MATSMYWPRPSMSRWRRAATTPRAQSAAGNWSPMVAPALVGGAIWEARLGHQPRSTLDDEVHGGQVGVRPVGAVPGDGGVDQPGVQFGQCLIVQSQGCHNPGTEVVHKNIRVGRQPPKRVRPLRAPEVEHHAPLAPALSQITDADVVWPLSIGVLAIRPDPRRNTPSHIPARRIHPNNFRPQRSQHPSTNRPRHHPRQVNNPNTFQRPHARIPPFSLLSECPNRVGGAAAHKMGRGGGWPGSGRPPPGACRGRRAGPGQDPPTCRRMVAIGSAGSPKDGKPNTRRLDI